MKGEKADRFSLFTLRFSPGQMSSLIPTMRHVRGFDVMRPLSIGMLVFMMMPLVFLPLLSIFIFGTNKGLASFWSALMAPEAIFALKLSMVTSFWATVFNVLFGFNIIMK